ncbi:MAG: hypothetical protein IPI03_23790 [Rubrivivax sp.]|nr:hypothetical protein [Rubrivivax sp.]
MLGHGGTLMGTGTVAQVLNLGGTIRPGFSPGTMTIAGDYTDVGGHVVIEIGPTESDFFVCGGKPVDVGHLDRVLVRRRFRARRRLQL